MDDPQRSNVVEVEWLARHLDDPSVAVVDCRFEYTNLDAGRAAYAQAHIPGAVYLDLERDLSGPKGPHGGRHPLPPLEQFSRTLAAVGVDESVTVVAYDMPQSGVAPRLWWLLRYLGYDLGHVLNGGWPAWLAAGLPVSRDVTRRRAPQQPKAVRPRPDVTASVEDVRRFVAAGGARLVDSRAPERFRGEVEPFDPVAGHIPGAVNLPWTDTLDEAGRLKPRAALAERFRELPGGGEVVVYCGSGVTACANLLAMEEAGLRGARLYPGSWSDWCSYPENRVAAGETPGGRPDDAGQRRAGRKEEQRK